MHNAHYNTPVWVTLTVIIARDYLVCVCVWEVEQKNPIFV